MSEPTICIDCRSPFLLTASEKVHYQHLVQTVDGFRMPKRCVECRKKRRMMEAAPQKTAPAGIALPLSPVPFLYPPPPVPLPAPQPPVPPPAEKASPPAPQKEEILFVLATTDFEELVHGRPVLWQGVRVVLADIGFKVMREAIERAETERAKAVFRKNGYSS